MMLWKLNVTHGGTEAIAEVDGSFQLTLKNGMRLEIHECPRGKGIDLRTVNGRLVVRPTASNAAEVAEEDF